MARLHGDLLSGRPSPQARLSTLCQPDLAATLKALTAAESSGGAGGREARLQAVRDLFYKGALAKKMAEFSRAQGGLLTDEDLADFQVREEPPVSTDYKGYQVFACGPWCQGPTVPLALKLLEGIGLAGMGHNSPALPAPRGRGGEADLRRPRALLRRP